SVLYIENPIIVSHKFPTKDTILSEAIFFLLSFVVGALFYKKDELKCSINLDELEEEYDVEINLSSVLKRFVGQFKVMSFFLKWAYKPEKVYVAYPNGYPGYIK